MHNYTSKLLYCIFIYLLQSFIYLLIQSSLNDRLVGKKFSQLYFILYFVKLQRF